MLLSRKICRYSLITLYTIAAYFRLRTQGSLCFATLMIYIDIFDLVLRLYIYVCVCVCACVFMCVCMCLCV